MLLLLCLGVEHTAAHGREPSPPMATPADMEQWASLQAPKTKGKPTPEQVRAALSLHRSATGWVFKRAARCSPRSRAPPAAPRSPAALAPQIAERKALAERAGAFLKDLSGKLGARPAAAVCGVLQNKQLNKTL